MGEHARLAGSGAGEDEQRPLPVLDRFGLRGIQPREQALDGGRTGADRRSAAACAQLVEGVEVGVTHPGRG